MVRGADSLFEIFVAVDFESTAKKLSRALTSVVDVLIGSIACVPAFCVGLFHGSHAKI